MRLLMVEDEKYMAEAVAQVLRKNNYSVDLVYNGEDGLDYGPKVWKMNIQLLLLHLDFSTLGRIVPLFSCSLSRNRVEGMAMAKMASLIFLGLVVPFFVKSDAQYLAALLPSFWVAKLCIEGNSMFILPALTVCLAWIGKLGPKFVRKLY